MATRPRRRTQVIVPVLPPPGAFLTDGERLCEVECVDTDGRYWLKDCMNDVGEANVSEAFPVLPESLTAGWRRVHPKETKRAA